ncbi:MULTISPECIES: phage tail protein [Acinetobacter]|uniref:phage tail protein n=1 Tax=Acinetobacter TaxID=469 RepID=UPI001D0D9709|nr:MULTISPECIES: phage tail protein [Acinetobacter]
MGGSSKQTVGFKYFAGMQVAIGNCIEQILNINPDKRGWIFTKQEELDQLKEGDTSIAVNKPDLFGGDKQEGGWVGTIDIHTGREEYLRQNAYLAAQDSELVSSFPGLSHLVFRGNSLDRGFQLVSMSGMLKEVLYWPKRTRIKDDGSPQWYDDKSEIGDLAPYNQITRKFSKNGRSNLNNGYKPIPAGIKVNSGTNILGSEIGEFNWLLNTTATPESGGNSIDFETKVKYGIDAILENMDLRGVAYEGSSDGGVFWDHGDFLDPNWEAVKAAPASVGAIIESVGFRAIYLIELKSRTRHEDFNIFMSSENSYIISNRFVRDFGAGYVEGRYLTIMLDAGDQAVIEFKTRNDLNASTSLAFRSHIQVIATNTEWINVPGWASNGPDINPIHQIREIITNDTAMNKPESMIHDANFKVAADRIFDEGLGVSGAFTEKSCKEAIDELLNHIEAGVRLNRQTGQYEIVLFRDDLLDLNNAMLFNKSNIKSFNVEIANIDDVINSVNVNYYDRENIKDSSFSLDEIGSVMSSEVNAQTLDFPYFMNRRNAELVGNWKLKQLSTPTRKGTFTTGKYEARKINKYDVVKLTWQNQNMFEVPVRIMKIGLGDGRDNTVTLDWVEVIPYSSTEFPMINVDPPTSVVLPPQPNQSIVFEMPYFEAVQRFGQTQVDAELVNNPDLGYLVVATKKPQSNSINALLYTDDGTGFQQASIVDYCPAATLDQNIGYLDSTFAVKNVVSISQAEVGTLILCDDELMVYQSYDTATKILTVKRAALDTVPKPHSQDAVFYFYDAFNAFDPEQYVLSEVIHAKVLTTTPSGVLDMLSADTLSLKIDARSNRPYPPANVKINSEYYPEEIATDLVVTWVDRNRLQQTGGSILGWADGGVSLESDAATMLIIKELDVSNVVIATHNVNATGTNTYTLAISTMQAETRRIEVTAKTVRNGYDSYQYFKYVVELSTFFSAPYNITYTVREV